MSSLRSSLQQVDDNKEEDGEAEANHICSMLSWCQKLHGLLTPIPRSQGSRRIHPPEVFVAMHLLGPLLANAANAQTLTSMLLHLVLPSVFGHSECKTLIDCIPKETVRDTTMDFDAACVLLRRAWNEEHREVGVSRYSWADSSPQAGRDWFVCKECN